MGEMWGHLFRVQGKLLPIFLLLLIVGQSFCSSSSHFWSQDLESIVIEATEEQDLQSLDLPYKNPERNDSYSPTRIKRQFGTPFQFQFPAGWPFNQQVGGGGFPGFPGFPSHFQQPTYAPTTTTTTTTTTPAPSQISQCRTRNGLQGRCASLRACYPFVYISEEGEEDKFRHPGLVEDIRERAGNCELHTMPNYLLFRQSSRSDMVCCANPEEPAQSPPTHPTPINQFPSNIFYPQITMRPPWAIWSSSTTRKPQTVATTTTTTTTQRPQTQRTTPIQSMYPNWPPPFITHPPSHFPSWVHQQPATHPPVVHTTTQRPLPPQPHWTHRPAMLPPQMVTTPQAVTQSPVSSSCGSAKIVGGSQATKGEFPWLVAIMRHGRQICGGSLIDNQWILSAAHCFTNFQGHDVAGLRIQVGDYDIYSNTDGPVTIRGVSKLVRHSAFSMSILHNDVALLKLDSPVQFGNNGNNNIQPICLARTGGYEGTTVTVAGWGGIYEGGPQPAIYKKVNLQVWDNQQCAAKYGHRAPGGITSQMVCAGSTSADACRGDSGGFLARNVGGRWEQIGVVSWGIGCGSYPGVYTRVDKYQDWIANNRRL